MPLLSTLLALTGPAAALDQGPTVSVGFGWMWVDPGENIDDSWAVVPRLGYQPGDHWILEAESGIYQGRTRTWGYGYDSLTPSAQVLFIIAPRSTFQPFLSAGGGAMWQHVRRDPAIWEDQAPDGTDLGNFKNPDTDGLFDLGPGFFIRLGGPVMLRLDFRSLIKVGTEPHGERSDTFANWELTAGIAYRAAERRRDTDHDGYTDREDGCPYDPEDFDRFEDEDGCPDEDNDEDGISDEGDDCPDDQEDFDRFEDRDGCPDDDNDGDGLLDRSDSCPNEAEDRDGIDDNDGCPDDDNDRDGVSDLRDRCPNDPEDRDGYQDSDGCPDDDNDSDGISDGDDRCPNQPESYNGHDDTDGCPDDKPAPPAEVLRFTGVIRGINFKTGSDEITVDSYGLLDEAADVFGRYPDLRFEVHGHTDSDGSDAKNMELSARRAQSVVAYLIRRGVNPNRMEWAGYGELKPLVPNTTAEGKAVNRRVEFHLIDNGDG
jgi:outer membrane protein OmpA-like peptidoglycan-associated protein